jgi:hypothetical protein
MSTNWVASGDFNGDGHLDLLVANGAGSSPMTLLLGHGDGTFDQAPDVPAGGGTVSVVVADLNRDGLPDAVVAESDDNAVGVLIHRTCQ